MKCRAIILAAIGPGAFIAPAGPRGTVGAHGHALVVDVVECRLCLRQPVTAHGLPGHRGPPEVPWPSPRLGVTMLWNA